MIEIDFNKAETILREIQTLLTDKEKSLAGIVSKCRTLALMLGMDEEAKWLYWELQGYKPFSKESTSTLEELMDVPPKSTIPLMVASYREQEGTFYIGDITGQILPLEIAFFHTKPIVEIERQVKDSKSLKTKNPEIAFEVSITTRASSLPGFNTLKENLPGINPGQEVKIYFNEEKFNVLLDGLTAQLYAFLARAEDIINAKQSGEKDVGTRTETKPKGPIYITHRINAQNVIMGDVIGGAVQYSTVALKEKLDPFFDGIVNEINTNAYLGSNEKQILQQKVVDFKQKILDKKIDGVEAAQTTKDIISRAPWLKKKFEELATGTLSSLLASGLVQGIKLALAVF